jgi:hypothetical protein
MIEKKSLGLDIALSCLFGPAGLIYSNVWLGLILTLITLPLFIIACFSVAGGIILMLIVHPICMILSGVTIVANNAGRKVLTSKLVAYAVIVLIVLYLLVK